MTHAETSVCDFQNGIATLSDGPAIGRLTGAIQRALEDPLTDKERLEVTVTHSWVLPKYFSAGIGLNPPAAIFLGWARSIRVTSASGIWFEETIDGALPVVESDALDNGGSVPDVTKGNMSW